MEVALGYFEDDEEMIDSDLTKPPSSGIEYLKRVQLEAAQCPHVVTATTPPVRSVGYIVNIIKTQALDESRFSFPCERLQLKVACEFTCMKQRFNRQKAMRMRYKIPKDIEIPACNTIKKWCIFSFGETFHKECLVSHGRSDDSKPINFTNTGANGEGHPPLMSIMLYLSQAVVTKLLYYNTEWLSLTGFSYDQGCWIFALLLCLDKPTPPDGTAALRQLCRRVILIRNALQISAENGELLHQLNLFIIIVTKCFGQSDLAMK